jgi:transposase
VTKLQAHDYEIANAVRDAAVAATMVRAVLSRRAEPAMGLEVFLGYLPQYSPDLNPIEQSFSKLKAHLRKAAERTVAGLCRRIGMIVPSFSPQECANYFEHAGYV